MVQKLDMQTSDLKLIFSDLLERNIKSIKKIGKGLNNKVYKLICDDSTQYASKLYFRHSLDNRDRLKVEFTSLQFLWENGIRCIPRPIVADHKHGCAVYEYIIGKNIKPQEITNSDIDFSVDLLVRLKELTTKKESRKLPSASEACFSGQAIVKNIEQRLNRLFSIRIDDEQYNALQEFLTKKFINCLDEIKEWSKTGLIQSGITFVSELPLKERTLSPSDFGFHNALRQNDNKIVFLDFEYFGWDDPAKMVSDFLLHPSMKLNKDLRQRFLENILTRFKNHRQLSKRIKVVYPLFGLKWCLILLNEFVPEHIDRRGFSSESELDLNKLRAKQLSKAKRMLNKIVNEKKQFPYHI